MTSDNQGVPGSFDEETGDDRGIDEQESVGPQEEQDSADRGPVGTDYTSQRLVATGSEMASGGDSHQASAESAKTARMDAELRRAGSLADYQGKLPQKLVHFDVERLSRSNARLSLSENLHFSSADASIH